MTPSQAQAAFDALFRRAVEVSGDYEPLLFPGTHDWATKLVFEPDGALDAWRGLLRGVESIDFKQVRSDVVGRIFQKLISPEERHRYGQHFTGDDAVDLINAFCIRGAEDRVLDPACGSGSFLVRAYYRKKRLDPGRTHEDLLSDLFGCDIAVYPAHLATLNLAAREINDEANYPRIVRRDFFEVQQSKPFVELPDGRGGSQTVTLPVFDAVVGNPPYVRQEKIGSEEKPKLARLVTQSWRDLSLSGRADLHCYFWPVATRLLKPDGYFGFLTSSSWLDVEYGFALQGWILRHFRLVAVLESADEPWFTDARVKTCVTILQRCEDEQQRMENAVRFVKFRRPLRDVIGVPSGEHEDRRQRAAEKLVRRIQSATTDQHDDDMRLIVKRQSQLWEEGVRAGQVLAGDANLPAEDAEDTEDEPDLDIPHGGHLSVAHVNTEYRAGKWGRFVRAPDFYFRVIGNLGLASGPWVTSWTSASG